MTGRSTRRGKRQIMAILAEPSRVELLNQLRVPTLVVHGTTRCCR